MSDVLSRLESALSDRYSFDGPVGHGGMATVYRAEDLKHHRQVAVKVLNPDIATALGGDRFLREIEIAAGLQHPHVLPLYDSGEANGLLYYVMPFVEGEPLSARLAREGALPVDETIRILRDVVDALAYAHDRGVVHRDVKPDNVMFSGKHAVVMDFGVAKALTEAASSASITSTGIALGTPAYMAPEQATADPSVDHRADIYAVGVLAYEMLAGKPPFAGNTPQVVLAAHVTEQPEPVSKHRSNVPAALEALVARCLEKLPSDRVQNTADLLHQLEAMSTPSGTAPYAATERTGRGAFNSARLVAAYGATAAAVSGLSYSAMMSLGLPGFVFPFTLVLLAVGLPILLSTLIQERRRASAEQERAPAAPESTLTRFLTWRHAVAGGVLAFASLGLVAAIYMLMRTMGIGPAGTLVSTGVLEEHDQIILADFLDRNGDTTLASAVTEAFRVDLGQSPTVTLVQGNDLAEAFERMELAQPNTITVELAREVSAREGIKAVVSGEINSVGGSYVLSAQVLDAATGNVLVPLRETARDSTELIGAIDRLSKGLRERVGESLTTIRGGPPLQRVTTASLPALRRYSQAMRASDAGDWGRASTLFEEAIALDSTFAAAYRALAIYLTNYGIDRARATAYMRQAYEHRGRLTEKERLWTEGSFHMSRGENDLALNAYLELIELEPNDPAVLNNIGVCYTGLRQSERALEYYERSRDLEPTSFNSSFNIVVTNIELGRLDAARAENERFVQVTSGHPIHNIKRFYIAVAESDYATAGEAMDAWAATGDPATEALVTTAHLGIAGITGQLAAAERALEQSRTRAESGRQVREYLLDAIGFGLFEIGTMGDTERGIARVEEALSALPIDRLEPFDRPYLELASFYARANRLERARSLVSAFESEVPDEFRPVTEIDYQRTIAFIALADGRTDDAIDAFRRSDGGSCRVCALPGLAQAYARQGNTDSLLAVLNRYVSTADDDRFFIDPLELPGAYVRLGEIYEARGDKESAIDYYDRFVNLWQDADAQLQARVDDIRQRLARLAAEGG